MESTDYMVKVVDVHRDNLKVIWPCLMHSIQKSSFVAIDCELSGLGDRKLINTQAVDERYSNIGNAAKTRSIISIGLCCFHSDLLQGPSSQKLPREQSLVVPFEVQTFNIVALCSEEYVVEPSALQFLVNHDFDFQKQYAKGVSYCRGSQLEKDEVDVLGKSSWDLRDIFDALVLARVPIVLHNGLVDLIFMYHNLYANLPTSFSSFLADLDMMFPGGIFDTKYIAEFDLRLRASFLEYVFRSCQLHNAEAKHRNGAHVQCTHSIPNSEYTDVWDCTPQLQEIPGQAEICTDYSNFGHCKYGNLCPRSHDVFRVILEEREKNSRKRRRKNETENEECCDTPLYFDKTSSQERFKGHRAGHDAFMTAYTFASCLVRKLASRRETTDGVLLTSLTKDVRNRVCLSGKDFPLLIQKSHFSKCSKAHLAKYAQLVPGTTET